MEVEDAALGVVNDTFTLDGEGYEQVDLVSSSVMYHDIFQKRLGEVRADMASRDVPRSRRGHGRTGDGATREDLDRGRHNQYHHGIPNHRADFLAPGRWLYQADRAP